jgi:hypothetical protein
VTRKPTEVVYRLYLQAVPGFDEVPVEVRLRRLLKVLLRVYGLRCCEVIQDDGKRQLELNIETRLPAVNFWREHHDPR